MLKLVYCVRRRPDLSFDEFRDYWLHKHGPKVRGFAATMRARKYVQSHTLQSEMNDLARQPRGTADPYDGITEIWWDSAEDLQQAVETAECQEAFAALIQDEAQFVDLPRSSLFFTEEHTIFEPPG
jgi:uncharacterized protein (TIGR02118 family)